MTIRAEVPTAYRVENATPPHVSKRDSHKKETDRDAAPTTDQSAPAKSIAGKVSEGSAATVAVDAKKKSSLTRQDRTPQATDALVRGPATAATKPETEDSRRPIGAQRPKLSPNAASLQESDTDGFKPVHDVPLAKQAEGRRVTARHNPDKATYHSLSATGAALKKNAPSEKSLPGAATPRGNYSKRPSEVVDPSGKDSGNLVSSWRGESGKKTGERKPTGEQTVPDQTHRPNTVEPDLSTSATAGTDVPHKAGGAIGVVGVALSAKPQQQSHDPSLFISVPPTIHLAEPAARPQVSGPSAEVALPETSVSTKANAASPELESTPSSEAMLQHELAQALSFGQTTGATQDAGRHNDDMVRHLQSEGVFGISSSGRNLGAVDFIRQKQFEHEMDQKPFTKEDLLTETEKAIYGTLNSSQSSSVTKSLLQAAESVNAYRNQSLKASERHETATHATAVKAARGATHA